MSANDRGPIITVTAMLVLGFLVGLVAGAYLLFAWAPPDWILRGASPRLLESGTDTNYVQYRDLYAAQIARRYQDQVSRGLPLNNAVSEAQNALGTTKGDATPLEAAQIVRASFEVARIENLKDGDAGWMTVADQNALGELAGQLESVGPTQPVVAAALSPLIRNARIAGFLLLLAMAALIYLLATWAIRSVQNQPTAEESEPTQAPAAGIGARVRNVIGNATASFRPPAQQNVYVAPNVLNNQVPPANQPPYQQTYQQPVQPPVQPPYQQTYQQPISQPASQSASQSMPSQAYAIPMQPAPAFSPGPALNPLAAEGPGTLLATFSPTDYRYGEDNYEEGFTINNPMGEFLGECGVSIAHRLDLTTPAKVCALGVWVFDKNDVQFKSVMKVVMTPNAFNDPVIRTQLNRLGEHVLAQNSVFEIDTATMRIEVMVTDLAVNPAGYFQNVKLGFNVYRKNVA